ncbi:MAG TPA: serine/threonine-protein kinase [Polyangia bacterium]|nr:serine/threonine-protein kinase [Polyangia bacterium]
MKHSGEHKQRSAGRRRLPPPSLGSPSPPPPPPPPPEPEPIVDLSDCVEEERSGPVAGPTREKERRHRRQTLISTIPAELAKSMADVAELGDESAAPSGIVEDEVTMAVPTAVPDRPEEQTQPEILVESWIDMEAEPRSEKAPARRAMPVLYPPLILDLRGVFRRDGAAVAGHLDLPDDIFVGPGPDRAVLAAYSAPSRPSSAAAPPRPGPAPRATDGGAAVPASSARAGSRPREETLPRGTIIDKYRIDRLLGRGGFAAVYRATHLLLNNQVAIKLLRPQVLARQPHLAKLLYEEARFAARIDHPNVVKVYDVTHSASITYIVMEYIEGRSLADTIARSGPLAWPRVAEIGAAVASGLKVALAARLIHRDIKPANILLGRRGEIKIVDLGLVLRARTAPVTPDPAPDELGPASGRRAAVGTYGYMAPEQAIDPERVDFRADIYSLGATLYEAAVGAPPFPLKDPLRCMEMHAHDPPPPPEQRRPGLPPALSALLLRMLAKKPDDRFASYDALAEAFARVAASAPHPPPAAS